MKTYDEIVSAKLFSYTQVNPDFGINLDGMEELIAYAAKVSNPSAEKQANMTNAEGLINFLIKHKHWSPLEMADATVMFTTTRDISHQVMRHRSFTFQEFSQRYAEALTEDDQAIEFVQTEARKQDHKNRQNSIELDQELIEDQILHIWWKNTQRDIAEICEEHYKEAINKGLAKEVARKILPEGLTTTRAFMKGSIRSWVHYIDLRSGNGTQKEHMVLCNAIADAVTKCFPMMKGFTHEKDRSRTKCDPI